jgi:hypothetical protein
MINESNPTHYETPRKVLMAGAAEFLAHLPARKTDNNWGPVLQMRPHFDLSGNIDQEEIKVHTVTEKQKTK